MLQLGRSDHLRLHLTNLAKLPLGILGGNRRGNDNVVTRQPVDRAGDTVLVGGLKSVDNTEDLGGVTASGGRVGHDQADLLGGVDDEDGTDGQGHTLRINIGGVLVVDHIVQVGDLALGIGDDGEFEVGAGNFVDVLDPAVVGLDVVGTQTDELDTTLGELRLELGESAELGGANGGKVIRVGEENGPLVTQEGVEVDGTI